MTPTPDLAKRVAGAVVERIATDRFCNSENIGDAVFRELAVVAAAKPAMANTHEQTVVITYRDAAAFMDFLRSHNAPLAVVKEAGQLLLSGVRL